jgi:dTDP-4-amino-4,6-dideoxygalactose transaminase
LILSRPEHVPAVRRVVNFGFERGEPVVPGLNGKCSEFHAAVGLAVARHMDRFLARRRAVAETYHAALAARAGTAPPGSGQPPWQTFPVLLPSGIRPDDVVKQAGTAGLELRRYYTPALHESRCFRWAARVRLAHAEDLARRMICLPIYSDMTDGEVARVLEIFGKVMTGHAAVRSAA